VSDERGLRVRVATAARRLSETGMNTGRSGNLSARVPGGFIVTPSGAPYETLHPDDLVFVTAAGTFGGERKPSSEWRLHRDLYARGSDVAGVVHTHSPHATTLACLGRSIPAFHYEVAFAGGADIRCAPYETFGTQALSDAAAAALEGRRACLLANHGVVAVGPTLEEAVDLAEKVEALARMYWQALQVGEPRILDAAEMARVVVMFASYGKEPRRDD
jgi:L-fuculose-phosphate aldolase